MIGIEDIIYTELSKANAKLIDWSQVRQDSWDTASWNDDSTACVVSWIGDTPATIASLRGVTTKSHKNLCDEIKVPGNKFRTKGVVPSKKKKK
tara:strand:- start:231 stop:509 length:279 start_codon:yes stop_codon:yes gene_type:complete